MYPSSRLHPHFTPNRNRHPPPTRNHARRTLNLHFHLLQDRQSLRGEHSPYGQDRTRTACRTGETSETSIATNGPVEPIYAEHGHTHHPRVTTPPRAPTTMD